MPPYPIVAPFIKSLRTGDTPTTVGLNRLVAGRKRAATSGLLDTVRKRGAFSTPLQPDVRAALKRAGVPERLISRCIDGWPDAQKEQARRAVVSAVDEGRSVRFRWGLTDARTCQTEITNERGGRVVITALSPRSTLRVRNGGISVAPAEAARRVGAGGRRVPAR